MNNTEKLKDAIGTCGRVGVEAIAGKADGKAYKGELLKVLEIMKAVSADDVASVGYPENIQNTLQMDCYLLEGTVSEEIDLLSLLNTVVTYIACNKEGLSEHSMVYMDRVTDPRKILEAVYDKEAIHFCGSDGC